MLQIAPAVVTAGEKLIHNQARIDLMMLEQSHSAAELARGDQWDREGYNSPYDWIRFNCHAPGNVAGTYLAVGVNLPRLAKRQGSAPRRDRIRPVGGDGADGRGRRQGLRRRQALAPGQRAVAG